MTIPEIFHSREPGTDSRNVSGIPDIFLRTRDKRRVFKLFLYLDIF